MGVRRASRLLQKRHREAERLFLTEGGAFLDEAVSTGRSPVETYIRPEDLKRVSSLKNSTAPVGVFEYLDVTPEALLGGERNVVLLDGVQDPGNVGTVVRSAHAFGAGVALAGDCADLYNPKTVRGTMGSIFHTPVAREVDAARFVEAAAEAGYLTAAAVASGGIAPSEIGDGRVLIVVGSEGRGLSEGVIAGCSVHVSIPSVAESLNAAVAASILLYEARSRGPSRVLP